MTWQKALDGMGAPGEWEPPPGLGPLPPELAPRAREVLAAIGAEIEALEERRDEVAGELAELARNASEPRPPHFLDTTA